MVTVAPALPEPGPAGVAATNPEPAAAVLAAPALDASLVSSTRHRHPDCANGAPVVSRSCTLTATRSPTVTVLVALVTEALALALALALAAPVRPSCAHSGRVSAAEKHAIKVRCAAAAISASRADGIAAPPSSVTMGASARSGLGSGKRRRSWRVSARGAEKRGDGKKRGNVE